MTGTAALLFFLVPMMAGLVVDRLRPGAAWLRVLLAFGGAFLLGVVFLHMLPELYEAEGVPIGAWVLGGFLLQVILEFFSKGIEHGHMHASPGQRMPLLTLISLCLHAFVEGIPFADAEVSGHVPFLSGVLLHKAPMAVALAAVLQRSHVGGGQALLLLSIFALSAPAGVLAGLYMGDLLGGAFLQRMLGLAIGMLLHIGTTIIFESAPEHRMDRMRFGAVLLGMALAGLSAH